MGVKTSILSALNASGQLQSPGGASYKESLPMS
jgi:hypothetical protein